MFDASVWRIAWKEYRTQRPLWLAIVVLTLLVQFGYQIAMTIGGENVSEQVLYMMAMGAAAVYALGCGATLFAAERETGTFEFQRGLPLAWRPLFVGKAGFGAASVVALAIVLWGVTIAMAGGRLPAWRDTGDLWGGGLLGPKEWNATPLGLLVPAAALWGLAVFMADQRRQAYRYFAEHGMNPRLVWLSRQVVGAAPLVAWLVVALLFLALCPQSESGRIRWPPPNMDARFAGEAVCCALLAYAAGQACSMFFRSAILALVGTVFSVIVLVYWVAQMRAAEISWSWSVLPIPVVLLAATWRRAPDWVLERTSWPARWRLGSTLAIPAAVLVTAVILVRIYEIPWVEPGFDVEEFLKPLTAEQRETAGMYIQATRILRLSKFFPDGQLAPPAMRADGTRAEPTLDDQRRWLEKSEEAITLLLTASRRLGGRYWDPVEGRTILGDGYLLSELAEALPASARLLEADGKLEQAWERYTAAIRMANCVRTEASLQLRLVGDRLEAAVCDQLPGWAAHPQQTPEQIKAALTELEGLSREVPSATSTIKDAYVAAVRPLEGDFRRIESQDPKSVRMLRLAYGLLPWETARARRLASYFTVKNLDRIECLERSLASDATTTLPRIVSFAENDPRWLEYREFEAWARTTPLASPGCWRMRDGFPDENLLQQEMYRRVVRIQLALLAWRHEHGQFPQTLDVLVGPYFDHLPLDPYCGRPFRYEPKGWPRDVHWIASNGSLLSGLQYRAVGPAAQMAIVVPAGCPFLWSGGNVVGFSRSQSDEPPTMLLEGNVEVYSGYLFPLDPKITSPTSR